MEVVLVEIALENMVCLVTAAVLMMYHECVRQIVYCCGTHTSPVKQNGIWKIWRYIDPVGMITALACCVPVSRSKFHQEWNLKLDRWIGIAGLCSLALAFAGSIAVLKWGYGGLEGLDHMTVSHWYQMLAPLTMQYMAVLSLGMLIANLFPIYVFDMSYLIVGFLPGKIWQLLRGDSFAKLIFLLVLMIGVIREAAMCVISMLL